jgi:hypothetical protein
MSSRAAIRLRKALSRRRHTAIATTAVNVEAATQANGNCCATFQFWMSLIQT